MNKKIVCSAFKLTIVDSDGCEIEKIFPFVSRADAWELVSEYMDYIKVSNWGRVDEIIEIKEGFLTNRNEFVDSCTALDIAKKADQLINFANRDFLLITDILEV